MRAYSAFGAAAEKDREPKSQESADHDHHVYTSLSRKGFGVSYCEIRRARGS